LTHFREYTIDRDTPGMSKNSQVASEMRRCVLTQPC
jgi:hypothetical protein